MQYANVSSSCIIENAQDKDTNHNREVIKMIDGETEGKKEKQKKQRDRDRGNKKERNLLRETERQK